MLTWLRHSCDRVARESRHPRRSCAPVRPGQLLWRHRQQHRGHVLPYGRRRRPVRLRGRPPQQRGRPRRVRHGRRRSVDEFLQRHRAHRHRRRVRGRLHLVADRRVGSRLRTNPQLDPRNPQPTTRRSGDRLRLMSVRKPQHHDRTGRAIGEWPVAPGHGTQSPKKDYLT